MTPPLDLLRRPLRNLRVSVTDRCNLRCGYCMPEETYVWLPRKELLRFEEILHVVRALQPLGVSKVRLTGGEPLLRKDLVSLVEQLSSAGLEDLALTTNGLLLGEQAAALRAAGLRRITVSLDSLDRARYADLTRRDALDQALAGLEAAAVAGFDSVKINAVMMSGRNDDELESLLAFAMDAGYELRFIEYMDVGGATRWSGDQVLPAADMLQRLEKRFGPITALPTDGVAPARRYALSSGQVFGIIASTTEPFCGTCDRARLTADGRFFTCLYAADGLDLRAAVREGLRGPELAEIVTERWARRSDRGAEERLASADRAALAAPGELAANPHLEMHTKGG